jgi:hypothetical protein
MMVSAEVSLVKRNVPTGGGTVLTILKINSSSITPGPLGIFPTNPNADAPHSIAVFASSMLLIQQIFILGFIGRWVDIVLCFSLEESVASFGKRSKGRKNIEELSMKSEEL